MGHDSRLARVTADGRLSILARHRRLLGLADGGSVVLDVVDGELRVRPVRDVINALQDEVSRTLHDAGTAADAFIAERHAQAARENGAK